MRGKHQHLGLKDGAVAQWQVNCHLVTVEVSVESCTDQRVKLNCFSFYKLWLEGLDTQTVKCRSPVEKNRMTLENVFKNIPYDGIFPVDDFLG